MIAEEGLPAIDGDRNQTFNGRQVQEAFDAHVGDEYIQHNPFSPTGRQESIAALSGMMEQVPELRFDFKRGWWTATW